MTDLFDLAASRQARDIGLEQVATSHRSWMEAALSLMQAHPCVETTGEQIAAWLVARGLPEPEKPHAWGSLINTLVRRQMIRDTGRVQRMQKPRSHARRTPVWMVAA